MKKGELDRRTIADHWRSCVRISREEVFGSDDGKHAPRHLQDDAATMFAGYVGVDWKPAVGLLLLAINPGGGGDAYESRTSEDQKFIPLLTRFKETEPSEVLESFELVNRAFMRIVKGWGIWKILDPTLNAAGVALEDVAYLNIVPYRTRNNQMPPAAARERAWKENRRAFSRTSRTESNSCHGTEGGKRCGTVVRRQPGRVLRPAHERRPVRVR